MRSKLQEFHSLYYASGAKHRPRVRYEGARKDCHAEVRMMLAVEHAWCYIARPATALER